MMVELHGFVDDDSFALVWKRKLGEAFISVEIQSGTSSMANDDVKNFRRAVDAAKALIPVERES